MGRGTIPPGGGDGMSLLDDARRLAAHDLRDHDDIGGYGFCPLCERTEGHRPDCPWLRLPRIVAVVEAAERVVNAVDDEPVTEVALDGQIYAICDKAAWPDGEHAADCAWQALKAALRGEALTGSHS
jgi:hypothetical protein